jgi:Protein of unknown function (DUF2975)
MSLLRSDPLLAAAKFLLILIGGIILFACVILIIGLVAVLSAERAEVLAQIAKFGAPDWFYWLVVGALVIVAAILAAILQFLRLLFQMVTSVDRGDPFVPANADRLTQMAWLTIGVQLAIMAVWGMAQLVERYVDDSGVDSGLSLSGWFLALVLFILARVFRHGTDLRAEVEGTI